MIKQGNEIATIDVALVTVKPFNSADELGLTTSNKVEVTPSTETTDAVKNIVKGVLIAQKPAQVTLTGNAITLTDNVFNAELVKILQGGTIMYWADSEHTGDPVATDQGYGVASYTPPVVGSSDKGEIFELNLYSAIYNAAGVITGYEKCTYPNCQGQPVAFGSEDNVFRVPEYTINSAPDKGEAPYVINYLNALPEVNKYSVTQTLSHATSSFNGTKVERNSSLTITLTADAGYQLATPTVTMGGVDITSSAWNSSTGKITISSVTGNVTITETATSM